jgi:hypothetical protein
VRITSRSIWFAILLVSVALAGASRAAAQEQDQDSTILMPDQSAAKAKQMLRQVVETLGGNAYLNVKDVTCTGRLSQFGHSGELNGYEHFIDYAKPPEKDRTENLPKRNLIDVFNGEKGWVLDRGGVSDAPESTLAKVADDQKKDIDNILRHRLDDKDIIFRYAGPDLVDLKEVDWVELVDKDNRTIRIAIVKATHLPSRKVVTTRDPNTRLRTEEVEYYSLYHPIDGVMTPFQITRERNNIKVYQVFFDKCDYNTNLADSLFTKESLDERWQVVGKKKINKDKKDAEKSSDSNKTGTSHN